MNDHGMGDERRTSTAPGRQHIVFLDPQQDRPVSPYTPEGEIQMMGAFAAGLRRRALPKRFALALIAIILVPVLLSVAAVISTWI